MIRCHSSQRSTGCVNEVFHLQLLSAVFTGWLYFCWTSSLPWREKFTWKCLEILIVIGHRHQIIVCLCHFPSLWKRRRNAATFCLPVHNIQEVQIQSKSKMTCCSTVIKTDAVQPPSIFYRTDQKLAVTLYSVFQTKTTLTNSTGDGASGEQTEDTAS